MATFLCLQAEFGLKVRVACKNEEMAQVPTTHELNAME
jgi:hypothetical protein